MPNARFAARTWPLDEFPFTEPEEIQELNRITPDGIHYEPDVATGGPDEMVQWVEPEALDIDAEHAP